MAHSLISWLPRFLSILLALFVGVFALDAIVSGAPFEEALLGFIIHLSPALLLLADLALAWRWEAAGGVAYLLTGLVFLTWFGQPWLAVLPVVVGLLFLVSRGCDLSRAGKEAEQ